MDVKNTRFLIIGGDSLIGAAFKNTILNQQGKITTTSRNKDDVSGDTLFLDLQDEIQVSLLEVSRYDIAYFCAGLSRYADIEENVHLSQLINVTNTLLLCARLIEEGCCVVFLSSSSVFNGVEPYPVETATTCPTTRYGRQKQEVEETLTVMGEMARSAGAVKIIRLSKILAADLSLIKGWKETLAQGTSIQPFMDLRLSPISLSYATRGLLKIGLLDQSGIYHLSGAADATYAVVAEKLLNRMGYPAELFTPVSLLESDVYIPFVPRFPSLGMNRTTEITGIAPQSLDSCIDELIGILA